MVNFLATLGWAYDGQTEIFSLDEAVQAFTLERIGVSPSVFDRGRLDWMNGVYIRALKPEELVERALPFLLAGLPEEAREIDREYAARVIALDQERLKTLADAPRLTSFFFVEQPEYDPALLLTKGLDAERASVALEVLIDRFEALEDWTHEALLATLDGVVAELGFVRTKGDGTQVSDRTPIFMLVRVAISGRKETPGLPETLAVLGKARALKRLKTARARLQPAVV